jgi:DNA-binding MarR family transcriptional regulator
VAGPHTLAETERTAESRIGDLDLDFRALSVVSNLFRAANAVRNHMESTVLAKSELTWTAFVVMWIAWIWGEAETRVIAEESGVSKATLSGVLNTLEKRGLAQRQRSEEDGRLVLVTLTPAGTRLIKRLFPEINRQEQQAVSGLTLRQQEQAADFLRQLVLATGHPDG